MMIGWGDKAFYISGYMSKNLDNYISGVLNKKLSAVFIIDGRSGLGKTTLASQLGCYISKKVAEWKDKHNPLPNKEKHKPKFSLNDLTWTPDAFVEKLKPASFGDIVVLDESMILSNRSAMSSYNRAAVIMMSMIRSKQIFVIFCINSVFDLDRNIALHRADMLVHLYAENDKFASRGRYFVVPTAKGKLKNLYVVGKKYYSYAQARPAFRDHFSKFFPFSDNEYEKRKQDAIQSYFNKEKKTIDKTRVSRDRAMVYCTEELGYKTKDLKKIFGMEERVIQMRKKFYKDRGLKWKDINYENLTNRSTFSQPSSVD
jgi:hypothetical protein